MSRHHRPATARGFLLRAVALVAVLVVAAWAVWTLGRYSVTTPPPPPPDPAAVRLAFVDAVLDGRTVRLRGGEVVQVAGLEVPAPGQCGADDSTRHARDLLAGRTVTVVPDARTPTVLHLVLATQQSYTDDALVNGWAKVAPGPLTYRAVFEREQDTAVTEKRGLWATCWRTS